MQKLRRAVASAAVVVGTLAGGVAGTAGTAQAADSAVVTYPQPGCKKAAITHETLNVYGGRFLCGGGFGETLWLAAFADGTVQLFVVGTDYAVWTRWENPNGSLSQWVSLGGPVAGPVSIGAMNGYFVQLTAKGTDGRHWFNNRQTNGVWTGWFR
ncbi:hypothetical protein [Kitasatospora sp. NPDC002965]|uniref:hypothetical protein n=1 Tax=Kitasatospora sp. NPDC002965 TaxID=3154775 RepID=UPI0033BF5D47